MTPEEITQLANKRAGAKLGWYMHLAIYLVVNAGLFLGSNLMFGHGRYSLGPLLGWGVGVAFHGIAVFLLGSGSDLRRNLVERERQRIEESLRK
jgi:2TM domain